MNLTQRLDLHHLSLFFSKKLLSIIRPPAKSVFGIHDPMGLSHLTKLRVGLSKLNLHKFRHNVKDTVSPMCPTNDGVEDTEHFLLLCPSFAVQRQNLLAQILPLLRPLGYANFSNEVLAQILLYGDENLPNDASRNILELKIHPGNRSFRLSSIQTLLQTTQPPSILSLQHLFVL